MLQRRGWVPAGPENYVQSLAAQVARATADENEKALLAFVEENHRIHERDCINLNPATNMMNPKAEALLASGIGSRPSLGYPGDKYEMGLEGIEKIEVMAAELAAEVFNARYAEIRVGVRRARQSLCVHGGGEAGRRDHRAAADRSAATSRIMRAGAAGLYGLVTHPAPVDAEGFTVDVDRLREDALRLRPKLITIGGSLNLFPHPIAEVRAIADEVGALVHVRCRAHVAA